MLCRLFDIGSHLLHRLPDFVPRCLHRPLDLSPYMLYLRAECLRLVIAVSVRHGRVRFRHLMYVCHLSALSYGPCCTSSRGLALEALVSATGECKLNAICTRMQRIRIPVSRQWYIFCCTA